MAKGKEITLSDLLKEVESYIDDNDEIELIKKAYDFAYEKHFGQKRITGDDYITHPLNVAYILTEVKADAKAISAALLHDTIEDCSVTFEEIENLFGREVAFLVDGVTKINKISFSTETEQIAANQRKILVGLSEDVRVIIIKLADRLHNLRTIYVLPPEKQRKKAKETLEILAPVAHRLGIYKIKSELEDLSLRYLKPDAYYDIVEKLNLKKTERDEAVGKMMEEVSELLNEHGITHEIKGRAKSIYSIYQKLNKGKKFNDIYDLLALRVFVNTEQECYLALGLIHSKYKPVPRRFKDYIAMPKTNLYQSLHTTVFGIDGELFEIQIRTYDMDKIAEYGIASHWSYKEHKTVAVKDQMEEKLQIFRSIIELNKEESSPLKFIEDMRKDVLTSDNIYVYTPKGDVLELPKNATPIDFAYKVHSEVGDKMIGAIVNDNIVPLNYKLQSGDIVKINTSKASKGPNKSWAKFCITAQARNHIRSYYSKLDKESQIQTGLDLLHKEIKKNNLNINDVLSNKNIDLVLSELNLKDENELYNELASGKILPGNVIRIIFKEEDKKEDLVDKIKPNTLKKPIIKNDILVEGIGEIKVSLSSCCKPVPGDTIIGYITKGNGITIHRSICKNIIDIDERLINVKWNDNLDKKYPTDLIIHTIGGDNLLEVLTFASSLNIQIESIYTLNKSDYKVYNMTILVKDKDTLNKFIQNIQELKYVKKVERGME